jgi:hypothetical protein
VSDYRTLKLALLADTSKFTSGLGKATKETQSFTGKMKANAAKIGKAFALAGVAVAGMAAKLAIDGVKAAIEDQAAQVKLATTLKNTTKAGAAQTKQVEKYIDKLQRASGVADNKLRPSLERFLVATGKVSKAQKLQKLAMDISAGTGKDLQTVTLALAKGYDGNLASIQRLGIGIDQTIIKNKDFKGAVAQLSDTFKGQASAAADTMEGKFKRFNIAIDEAKESIGVALMPALTDMVDFLNSPKGQKVVTDFAEAFADAIKMMAKYLPGVVEHITNLVSKVSKQGLMAGLLSDPKLAIAAAAYGAGFIYGGPAGGAIAAVAAYAGASAIASSAPKGGSRNKGNLVEGFQSVANNSLRGVKSVVDVGGAFGTDYAGTGISGFTGTSVSLNSSTSAAKNIKTGNIIINIANASDAISSARAIERTLKKLGLNGGSKAGVLGFN